MRLHQLHEHATGRGVPQFARRLVGFVIFISCAAVLATALSLPKKTSPVNRVLLQAFPAALNDTQGRSLTSKVESSNAKIADKPGGTCLNSKQGRNYITDERGYVCGRMHLNSHTGCCPTAGSHAMPKNTCHFCDANRTCCSHYEFCVSCCLRDEHRPRVMSMISAGGQWQVYESVKSAWQWCLARCRTTSISTVHGNTYKHRSLPYCMNITGRSLSPNEADAAELVIKVGSIGEDCSAVCNRASLVCEPTLFKAINKCEVLQQITGCVRCTNSFGYDQPAQVVGGASHKNSSCLVNNMDSYFACNGKHPNTRRICPCVSIE